MSLWIQIMCSEEHEEIQKLHSWPLPRKWLLFLKTKIIRGVIIIIIKKAV